MGPVTGAATRGDLLSAGIADKQSIIFRTESPSGKRHRDMRADSAGVPAGTSLFFSQQDEYHSNRKAVGHTIMSGLAHPTAETKQYELVCFAIPSWHSTAPETGFEQLKLSIIMYEL